MRTLLKQYSFTLALFILAGGFVLTVYGGFHESTWAVDPIRNPVVIGFIAAMGFFAYMPVMVIYFAPPLGVSALIFVLLCNALPRFAQSPWVRGALGALAGASAAFVVESVTFRWNFDLWLSHNAIAYALAAAICGALATWWPRFRPTPTVVAGPASDRMPIPDRGSGGPRIRMWSIAGLHAAVTVAACAALIAHNLRTEQDVFFKSSAENAATRFRAQSVAGKGQVIGAMLDRPNPSAIAFERAVLGERMNERTIASKEQLTAEIEALQKRIEGPRFSARSLTELSTLGDGKRVQARYVDRYAAGEVSEYLEYRLQGREVVLSRYSLGIEGGGANRPYVGLAVEQRR